MTNKVLLISLLAGFIFACEQRSSKEKRFERLPAGKTGINFINTVENTEDFNIFNYRNFYNGGGVAIGDINDDGLADVYFTSNLGDNKLYLNMGNFKFKDISESSGTTGTRAWSTGVVFVDINNDALLDIYVCNAGYIEGDDHENELFINQGDLTFKEAAAEYGLNESGYTTHVAFFDYDGDEDLDVYILNNSFVPVSTLNYSNQRELYAEDWPVKDFIKGGGDKLLRNDNNRFIDVTKEAGIYGSLIGFGLGVTLGDVNDDNLIDIYISNDFFERDYLYVNQGDGTFTEEIKVWMGHISLSSMGADMADIDNDGNPEIFVTEMLPDNDTRIKITTSFENYNTYLLKLNLDFYHQYMHNTLQYNNGDDTFSEISWYSGVSASDWSWGALMFDADNDGLKDLYVCNGVYQDVTDQDFIDFFASDVLQRMAMTGKKEELGKVVSLMPSKPQINKFFRNQGGLKFEDSGVEFGFDEPTFSNGAAYGDLDNDGDLDLVLSNLNQESYIYRNNTPRDADHHFIGITLKGPDKNKFAIGSKIKAFTEGANVNFELIPTRGFQSSVDYKVILGVGSAKIIDSLVVVWPDGKLSKLYEQPVDTVLTVDYARSEGPAEPETIDDWGRKLFREVQNEFEPHQEDNFVDFFQEGLVMKMLSREGPSADKGDLNGDGLDDILIGGANNKEARIYLQNEDGFVYSRQEPFVRDAYYEDTVIKLFDADGDGDLDLFGGSGGNNYRPGARFLQDRLYLNDGFGNYALQKGAFPSNGFNTSVAIPFDFDGDKDLDLFVGSRSIPGNYGTSPRSYLYENDGNGKFRDVTTRYSTEIRIVGMVTDAAVSDVNGNGLPDLVIVGEWMSPKIFELREGKFIRLPSNLEALTGWWYALNLTDLDGDGDKDLILGNRGENFYFTGDEDRPAKLWLKDFDNNGTVEKIITRQVNGTDKPVTLKRELTDQVVSLEKQNLKHNEYATMSIQDLFTDEQMEGVEVKESTWFKSIVAINLGNESFEIKEFPRDVQFSCVCAIYCTDLNGDSYPDVLLGGNDSGFLPQFSRLDASFGHVLLNDGSGSFDRIRNEEAGLLIKGDLKQFLEFDFQDQPHLLVNLNNDKPLLYKINK